MGQSERHTSLLIKSIGYKSVTWLFLIIEGKENRGWQTQSNLP
jgi:hypothetical protein